MNVLPFIQSVTKLTLLFELVTGSSRVSVGESSRPVIKGASLDHELVLRRHATSLRSQNGNMDDTIVMNGKCFIMLISFESGPYNIQCNSFSLELKYM